MNKEERKKYMINYRKKKAEEIKIQRTNYRKQNKQSISEGNKQYQKKNADKIKKQRQKWWKDHHRKIPKPNGERAERTKVCVVCRSRKPLSAFRRPDFTGRIVPNQCRECYKERIRTQQEGRLVRIWSDSKSETLTSRREMG